MFIVLSDKFAFSWSSPALLPWFILANDEASSIPRLMLSSEKCTDPVSSNALLDYRILDIGNAEGASAVTLLREIR